MLRQYGLDQDPRFVAFVNEQLLITAQNYLEEVNILFGATALCYTLFTNYYVPGGLQQMVQPIVDYIEARGGQVLLRQPVTRIQPQDGQYLVTTEYRKKQRQFLTPYLVSAIPINNTLALWQDERLKTRYQKRLMQSEALNSAFQLGFVMRRHRAYDSLHHQVHLSAPLPQIGSHSIFLSLSHPDDPDRCGPDEVVGSVSTHVPDPAHRQVTDKEAIAEAIFAALAQAGLVRREDITYWHASTPGSWQKWTARAWGFVGGYPQYMRIKPWHMLDARLDHRGAYICGDSTYPGQGIPGACLSGIIAYEKMVLDGLRLPTTLTDSGVHKRKSSLIKT
ncbi:MAG: hypothetical protein D6722_03255 [Bacteroidetes bacterium]|nr:MAG: hypothetical protein D6722_03255 [Bacteroidota bacterium]